MPTRKGLNFGTLALTGKAQSPSSPDESKSKGGTDLRRGWKSAPPARQIQATLTSLSRRGVAASTGGGQSAGQAAAAASSDECRWTVSAVRAAGATRCAVRWRRPVGGRVGSASITSVRRAGRGRSDATFLRGPSRNVKTSASRRHDEAKRNRSIQWQELAPVPSQGLQPAV